MSGELVGVLAGMTIVGSLNIAILVFVFNISRELGSMAVRVDHLEQGVTDTLGARMDQFELEIKGRVDQLERRATKRSDEIHPLVRETRSLKELVAKAMDPPLLLRLREPPVRTLWLR